MAGSPIALPTPKRATATDPGAMVLTEGLTGSWDKPQTADAANVSKHVHGKLYLPASAPLHTNNIGNVCTLYPHSSKASVLYGTGGNYVIILNSNFTGKLSTRGLNTPLPDYIYRDPEATIFTGVGPFPPNPAEYMQEIMVTFIQDNVGGWTPTINTADEVTGAFGGSLGSGTAGQMRSAVYRYFGPHVGWKEFWKDSAWVSSPYTLNNSSTRANQWVRGVGAGGTIEQILDSFVTNTPLNYRKALYLRGFTVQYDNTGSALATIALGATGAGGSLSIGGVSAQGVVISTLARHMTAIVASASGALLCHESGHAADFLLGPQVNLNQTKQGAIRQIKAINDLWQLDFNDWSQDSAINLPKITEDGVGDRSKDGIANAGWTGSTSYTISTRSEWMAQVIGGYMMRKADLAASRSTSTSDGMLINASNPARRTTLLATLDQYLSDYI